jgi:hypothetical protein
MLLMYVLESLAGCGGISSRQTEHCSFEKLRSLGDDVNIRELYLTEMDENTEGAMAVRTSPNQ